MTDRDIGTTETEGQGWLLLPLSLVPALWRERAAAVAIVPLLPEEAVRLLEEGSTPASLGPEDQALLGLVGEGRRPSEIAKDLGLSVRAIQHRLARLRRRFKVDSTSELALVAARAGFGSFTSVKQSAGGSGPQAREHIPEEPRERSSRDG